MFATALHCKFRKRDSFVTLLTIVFPLKVLHMVKARAGVSKTETEKLAVFSLEEVYANAALFCLEKFVFSLDVLDVDLRSTLIDALSISPLRQDVSAYFCSLGYREARKLRLILEGAKVGTLQEGRLHTGQVDDFDHSVAILGRFDREKEEENVAAKAVLEDDAVILLSLFVDNFCEYTARVALFMAEHTRHVTLDSRSIQSAICSLPLKKEHQRQCILQGTKYVTEFVAEGFSLATCEVDVSFVDLCLRRVWLDARNVYRQGRTASIYLAGVLDYLIGFFLVSSCDGCSVTSSRVFSLIRSQFSFLDLSKIQVRFAQRSFEFEEECIVKFSSLLDLSNRALFEEDRRLRSAFLSAPMMVPFEEASLMDPLSNNPFHEWSSGLHPLLLARHRADEFRLVESVDEFIQRIQSDTFGVLSDVLDVGIFLAGGSVLRWLLRDPVGFNGSDYDFFFWGKNERGATVSLNYGLRSIIEKAKARPDLTHHSIKETKYAISVTLVFGSKKKIVIQFITRLYRSPLEVLTGFDIDSCSVGFDGEKLLCTKRFMRSIAMRYNLVDITRRSLTYEYRLWKYSLRGFAVACPGLQSHFIDLAKEWSVEQAMETRGLGRLLSYHVGLLPTRRDVVSSDYWEEPITQSDVGGRYAILRPEEVIPLWVTKNPGSQLLFSGSFHPLPAALWDTDVYLPREKKTTEFSNRPLDLAVSELRSCHQILEREWNFIKSLMSEPSCIEARGRTVSSFSGLEQETVLEFISQLGVVEASFAPIRETMREQLMKLLSNQMQVVAAFMLACSSEIEVLTPLVASAASSSDDLQLVSSTQTIFEEFCESVAELNRIERSIKEKVEIVNQTWSFEGAISLESFVASARKEMEEIVENVHSAKEITCMMERCRNAILFQYAQRLQHVQAQQADVIQFFHKMDAKYQELKRALEAGKQVESVQARLASATKALDRSKRDVTQLEAKLKNAIEDLDDGIDGADDKVNKAQQKVIDARARVVQCRREYEAAVASLIEIRQAGYPELRCPAAEKNDRFPNVPTIAFSELDLDEKAKIGHGTFADVFRVELPVTGPCAFKRLRGNIAENALMKEAAAMWELRHSANVIRLLKVCTEPGQQGLLLELADGGSLGDLLHVRKERLTEAELLQILHDAASGLECVHQHNHVHLDVKADNVLLTKDRRAKLADFGASKQARTTYRDTKVALTFQWSAPEMLQAMPKISSACDIWSFGMLMFEVLTGDVPFANVEVHKLAKTIADGVLPKLPSTVNPSLAKVMQKCWQMDPAKRPTASELLAEIGSLLARPCTGPCLNSVVLTKGLLCNRASSFVCFSCVPEALESNLRLRSVRADGALQIGNSIFEFHAFRSVLDKDLLNAWLKGQQEAMEAEARQKLEAELEREKRKWEETSVSERVANSILWDVLPCRCPKCKERLYYSGGCFALTCDACKSPFCAFCERVFSNGSESHEHVPKCKSNTLGVPWYPNANEQQETFARVQRERQVRDVKKRLAMLDESTRDEVLERIKGELASLDIDLDEV
jgi:serine/threonine protein kinase